MNKINFILSEFLNALQVAEGIIKGHPSVNNVKNALLSSIFSRERVNKKEESSK